VNGSAMQTIMVTLKDDAAPEVLEWMYARLTNAVNATIKGYEGIGYVYDDDPATVNGFVFFDTNGNGFFDDTMDYGLPGVMVKLHDYSGDQVAPTDSMGNFSAMVFLGDITVTVDETTTPVGTTVSTGNNPQTVQLTLTALDIKKVGLTVEPKKGKPTTSIGNGLVFFNDTVYGGPGNDLIDGGGGDDWLIGGHWLGPV